MKAAVAAGREAMVDCEHFFDGYKANPKYALACARAAIESGARWAVLCDTNGGTLPDEVERIVAEVARAIPGEHLGIHAHNDTGNAVANSLAAIRAGARQVQGALNGLGERCGNANLVTLIPTLALKPELAERFETGVTPEALRQLTGVSRAFDELLNRAPNRHAPYVGASAFATKAGIHASALAKDPRTYEHVAPESVGNARAILVSDQAGRSNLLAELKRLGVEAKADDPRLQRLLDEVKAREAQGYAYEAADASFELLARSVLGGVPEFFAVESFHVGVERKLVGPGVTYSASQAVVKIRIGEERLISAAEGNGPVNALDLALRKDLGVYQKHIEDLELRDYRVRVFQGGTDAVTRVLIEFGDKSGRYLVDGRRLRQHHRRLVPGAGRRDRLPAAQGRRRGAVTRGAPLSRHARPRADFRASDNHAVDPLHLLAQALPEACGIDFAARDDALFLHHRRHRDRQFRDQIDISDVLGGAFDERPQSHRRRGDARSHEGRMQFLTHIRIRADLLERPNNPFVALFVFPGCGA